MSLLREYIREQHILVEADNEQLIREIVLDEYAEMLAEGVLEKAVTIMVKPALSISKNLIKVLSKASGSDNVEVVADAFEEVTTRHLPVIMKAAVKAMKNPKAMMKLAKWFASDMKVNFSKMMIAMEKRIMQAAEEMEPAFYKAIKDGSEGEMWKKLDGDNRTSPENTIKLIGCIGAGACTPKSLSNVEVAEWFESHEKKIDMWVVDNVDELANVAVSLYSEKTGDKDIKLEGRLLREYIRELLIETAGQRLMVPATALGTDTGEYRTEWYWQNFRKLPKEEQMAWAEKHFAGGIRQPLDVRVYADGSLMFSDGHHRAKAAALLGEMIPIIISRNQLQEKSDELWEYWLDLVMQGLHPKYDLNPEGWNIKTLEQAKELTGR